MADTETDNVIPLQPPARHRGHSGAETRDISPVEIDTGTPPVRVAVTPPDRITLPPAYATTVPQGPAERRGGWVDLAAYVVAIGLAGAAAFFSIRGMVVIFPGSPIPVVVMAIAMESAKLVTAGWLARRWSSTAAVWRAALVMFVFGLAVINAAGVYAQLVSAHVGERGVAQSNLETKTADLEAKIDVQAHRVADLDRRLAQIDAAVEKATEKGRTTAAMRLADDQRKSRAALADERNREAATLQP